MVPFVEKFPELGARETRSVRVFEQQDLMEGEYGFLEFYCNGPGCDCRRVIIQVLRPETGWRTIWATIGYGWESLDFYRKWDSMTPDPSELKGPYLDPLNPQTKYAPALLELFRLLIESPDYVERLKRHYRMFRAAVDKEQNRHAGLDKVRRLENKRKHLRDPNRRRRGR
jgi:hypothetical protein